MNKKFLALLSAGALTATLLAGCGSGGNTDPSTAEPSGEEGATLTTIESGKLIMSTNAQFPPYELVSDGEGYEGTGYEGIDVEIAYALAQKLGLELVIDDMDFDGALLAVQNGKSDMVMAGVTVNEERLVNMDFTDSYANGVQVVIVPEDSSRMGLTLAYLMADRLSATLTCTPATRRAKRASKRPTRPTKY